MQHSEKTAVI